MSQSHIEITTESQIPDEIKILKIIKNKTHKCAHKLARIDTRQLTSKQQQQEARQIMTDTDFTGGTTYSQVHG